MKINLARDHRRILETTVAQARTQAEDGAAKALTALAVAAKDAPGHATELQKELRVHLRAHGRALGDVLHPDGTQASAHLVTEIAYEHWHRMLFARFLAESNLLMHPDGYPVSLADCKEDAAALTPPARSEWEVAGAYASAMLPNVFRVGSPVLALQLPLETEQALEALLAKLPATVFQADDSLGWSYQFWQAQKKEDV
ncbi:MAG: SAM-dependent DNA methyltransferase, partial [Rhodoferax sp.]